MPGEKSFGFLDRLFHRSSKTEPDEFSSVLSPTQPTIVTAPETYQINEDVDYSFLWKKEIDALKTQYAHLGTAIKALQALYREGKEIDSNILGRAVDAARIGAEAIVHAEKTQPSIQEMRMKFPDFRSLSDNQTEALLVARQACEQEIHRIATKA